MLQTSLLFQRRLQSSLTSEALFSCVILFVSKLKMWVCLLWNIKTSPRCWADLLIPKSSLSSIICGLLWRKRSGLWRPHILKSYRTLRICHSCLCVWYCRTSSEVLWTQQVKTEADCLEFRLLELKLRMIWVFYIVNEKTALNVLLI